MQHQIDSRKLNRTFTFTKVGEKIYIDTNNLPGSLGIALCESGKLQGDLLTHDGNCTKVFADRCRRWWKAYMRDK